MKILFAIEKKASDNFVKFIESRTSPNYNVKIVIVTDEKNIINKFLKIPDNVSIYHVRKILPKYLFESNTLILSSPKLFKKLKKSIHNYRNIYIFSTNGIGNVKNLNTKVISNFTKLEEEILKNHDKQ